MRSVRLLLTSLVIGLLLSGCGQREMDTAWVEKEIVTSGLQQGSAVRAHCPDTVVSSAGRHFTCTVTIDDRGPADVDVTIEDGDPNNLSVHIAMPGSVRP